MPDSKPDIDKAKHTTPELDNVEPGSDANETPAPEPGKTPPDPNKRG